MLSVQIRPVNGTTEFTLNIQSREGFEGSNRDYGWAFRFTHKLIFNKAQKLSAKNLAVLPSCAETPPLYLPAKIKVEKGNIKVRFDDDKIVYRIKNENILEHIKRAEKHKRAIKAATKKKTKKKTAKKKAVKK